MQGEDDEYILHSYKKCEIINFKTLESNLFYYVQGKNIPQTLVFD